MKRLLSFALLSAVMLAGCDKLKDATSKDFTVNGVRFEFNAEVESAALKSAGAEVHAAVTTRAGEMNPFSVTRTVSLSEISSSELIEYKKMIDKVKANSSLIEVTVTPSGSYSVANLTIEATGVAGSPLTVPSLSVGGAFTPPAGMDAFTSAFVMKLITTGSVQVTVSGMTDAPAGTTVGISYENDLLFTASLL